MLLCALLVFAFVFCPVIEANCCQPGIVLAEPLPALSGSRRIVLRILIFIQNSWFLLVSQTHDTVDFCWACNIPLLQKPFLIESYSTWLFCYKHICSWSLLSVVTCTCPFWFAPELFICFVDLSKIFIPSFNYSPFYLCVFFNFT